MPRGNAAPKLRVEDAAGEAKWSLPRAQGERIHGSPRPDREPKRVLEPSEAEEIRNLLVGGKAAELELREDKLAVEAHLEGASAGLHELDLGLGNGLLQFSGQTGRLRGVVSLNAIFDADLHEGKRGSGRRKGGSASRKFGTDLRKKGRRPGQVKDGSSNPALPEPIPSSEALGSLPRWKSRSERSEKAK